jgi:predicted secreted protein
MAADKGSNFKIIKGSSGVVICSGIMSKKLKYIGPALEITSDDDTGYRTFHTATGTKGIDISFEAVLKDTVLRAIVFADARMLTDVYFLFNNGDKITANFFLSNYSEDYNHDEVVKISGELQTSGPYTYVPHS